MRRVWSDSNWIRLMSSSRCLFRGLLKMHHPLTCRQKLSTLQERWRNRWANAWDWTWNQVLVRNRWRWSVWPGFNIRSGCMGFVNADRSSWLEQWGSLIREDNLRWRENYLADIGSVSVGSGILTGMYKVMLPLYHFSILQSSCGATTKSPQHFLTTRLLHHLSGSSTATSEHLHNISLLSLMLVVPSCLINIHLYSQIQEEKM